MIVALVVLLLPNDTEALRNQRERCAGSGAPSR